MEQTFGNAIGKSTGEVLTDIEDFLSAPYLVHKEKRLDLCTLLPDLNMKEQLLYALLTEAEYQKWEPNSAENFCRRAFREALPNETVEKMILAFHNQEGEDYRYYTDLYGNRFEMQDGSYWASCLAVGIDAGEPEAITGYLRKFLTVLTEFSYMNGKNPPKTYAWGYFQSFNEMLKRLTEKLYEDRPLPVKVKTIGGSVARAEAGAYYLSLGVDFENPNKERMATGITIRIVLKDKEGKEISILSDKLNCIDPGTVYHYGITKKIVGASVASFAATATASGFLHLKKSIMKHTVLSDVNLTRGEKGTVLSGILLGDYDVKIRTLTLHYQLLSEENRLLGGGGEWFFDGLDAHGGVELSSKMPMFIKTAAKAVYSVDFDPAELIGEKKEKA